MMTLPQMPAELASALRDRLKARETALRAEIAEATHVAPPAAHEVIDRKDEAADQARSLVGDAEVERDRAELAHVEAALARFAQGSYGECTDCGETIPTARLQAQPEAARCAACQQRAETAARVHRTA